MRRGWTPDPALARAWSMSEWQTAQDAIRNWQQARTDAPGTEQSGNFGNQPATGWDTGAGLTVASDTAADVEAMNLELNTKEGKRTLAKRVGATKRRRVEVARDETNQVKTVQFVGSKPKGYQTASISENLNRRIVKDSLESSILMIMRAPVARKTEARGNRWIESIVNLSFTTGRQFINVLSGLTVGTAPNAEFEGSKIVVKAMLIKLKFYIGSVVSSDAVKAFSTPIRVRVYQTSLPGFSQPSIDPDLLQGLGFIAPEEQEFFSLLEQRNMEMYIKQPDQGKTGASKIRVLELYINKGMRPVEVASGSGITDYTPTSGNIAIMLNRDFIDPGNASIATNVKGWVKTFYQCEEIYKN